MPSSPILIFYNFIKAVKKNFFPHRSILSKLLFIFAFIKPSLLKLILNIILYFFNNIKIKININLYNYINYIKNLNKYYYIYIIELIQYFSKNLGSEVYVLDIPEENIFAKFHSQPGCILLVNTVQKKIISNGKSKAQFANLYP